MRKMFKGGWYSLEEGRWREKESMVNMSKGRQADLMMGVRDEHG